MSVHDLLRLPPYSLRQAEKEAQLLPVLNGLTVHHQKQCPAYARLVEIAWAGRDTPRTLADLPYLPVSLFKRHTLASVPSDRIVQTLTSSGTSGQQPSRIFLDQETADLQSRALVRIMTEVLGPRRLPMLVVDVPGLFRDRTAFSARGAGVLGMMKFGVQPQFVLDEQMHLNVDLLKQFLLRHGDQPFLVFGFTFMVWRYFYEPLRDLGLDLSHGILIHSGGWKKLQEAAVDDATFKQQLREKTGLSRVHNFYGMVEQVGSVFLEGDDGLLHPPVFADVIVRDLETWQEAPTGRVGVLHVVSALPMSYPGHSLLTEDLGVVHRIDAAEGLWQGKAFSVVGRVPRAELRGCSDTFAASLDAAET
jgi:hypothetical protein